MSSDLDRELEALCRRLAGLKRDPAAEGDAAVLGQALLDLRSHLRDLRQETECWKAAVEHSSEPDNDPEEEAT